MDSVTHKKCSSCRLKNSHRISGYNKKWYSNNKDISKKTNLLWYTNNKDRAYKKSKEWKRNNADKVVSYDKKYRENNPDKIRQKVRNRRALKKKAEGKVTVKEWTLLKEKYNYMCLCCKRKEPEIEITQDHVIPLKVGGKNLIDNIQPLCRSCNSKKGIRTIDYR